MGIRSVAKIEAGFIMDYAGNTPPAGWLQCAGQAVSRSTYAKLFLAIGTLYGVGDGATTFNLPDLRGRAVFGKDDMNGSAANRLTTASGGVDGATVGAVGGSQAVTLTEAQMPSHSHSVQRSSATTGGSLMSGTTTGNGVNDTRTTVGAGSSGAHQNIPPAIVAYKIIKF